MPPQVLFPSLVTFEPNINFLSLNVGMSSTLAGLSTLIISHKLDVIFLQEVRLSSEQLELLLGGLGFKAAVNIDHECPTSPGTALVWRTSLPVTDVCTLLSCRAQVARLGHYMLLNLYAQSGSDKKHERNRFFARIFLEASSWVLRIHGCLVVIIIVC